MRAVRETVPSGAAGRTVTERPKRVEEVNMGQLNELMGKYGILAASRGHARNVVTLVEESGAFRVYRVKLAERQTTVDIKRRLRNAMDGQGCMIKGFKEDAGEYVVIAEVR